MPSFVAVDVETANSDLSSICQIGIASFEGGRLIDEWATLVDPEDKFAQTNIGIHGINKAAVKGSPTFPNLIDELKRLLDGKIVVCHTHFDMTAITKAFSKYSIPALNCRWLDSARVARRTWSEFSRSGYGLKNICSLLGYDFKHHDALEDAKAAGQIMLAAITKSGVDIEAWLKRLERASSSPLDKAGVDAEFIEVAPYAGRKYQVEGARQFQFKVLRLKPNIEWSAIRGAVYKAYTEYSKTNPGKGLRFKLARKDEKIIVQSVHGVDVGLLPQDLSETILDMLLASPYSGTVFIDIRDWENPTGVVALVPGLSSKLDWVIE